MQDQPKVRVAIVLDPEVVVPEGVSAVVEVVANLPSAYLEIEVVAPTDIQYSGDGEVSGWTSPVDNNRYPFLVYHSGTNKPEPPSAVPPTAFHVNYVSPRRPKEVRSALVINARSPEEALRKARETLKDIRVTLVMEHYLDQDGPLPQGWLDRDVIVVDEMKR